MERIYASIPHYYRIIFSALAALMLFALVLLTSQHAFAASEAAPSGSRIITLHDHGIDKGFITKKSTLRAALAEQHVYIDRLDRTEPGLDEPLVASSYQVNIYRARQVLVRDGDKETKVITSYRTPKQIAKQAKITLYDEDKVRLASSNDPIADGVAEVMTIARATAFNFDFYGKAQQNHTMARTVGDMLKEKGITMAETDDITPARSTLITANMQIRLWRNGIQTQTVEEDVAFDTKQVANADQPVGYKSIQTPGEAGKRTVTYEVNMQNGVEVSRKEINSVTTKQPSEQVESVGTKPNGNGLTKAKGVMMFTDSNGVTHRETYYDLPMNRVMTNCGAGGHYTVRSDGAKIDAAGYVIVAAHLGNYPRCSVVETSIGPGKVYDTGGFVERHPHGFDLATDWTKGDGI